MTLGDIYDFFVQEGIRADLRSKKQVQKKLSLNKQALRDLNKDHKKFFDKDSLKNPYSDTRILYGHRQRKIKGILVGIDIGIGELLLVEKLKQSGRVIDLVIAHHPLGSALAGLSEVMDLQTDLLQHLGMDANIAQSFMEKRIKAVARGVHGSNHMRTVDAARLLDIPLMCCHTPSDNHVASYLQKLIDRNRPKILRRIIDMLLKEEEYQDAMRNKAGPVILIGRPEDQAGKVMVDMTGGTEGSKEVFARISQLGIKTILGMHLSEAHYNRVKAEHINVVIAGHMASDNLGLNLLLDRLVRKSDLEIHDCSGFRRFRR